MSIKPFFFIFFLTINIQADSFLITPRDPLLAEETGLSKKELAHIILDLEKHMQLNVTAWKKSYRWLPQLIRSHNLKIGCEVGVAFGTHSQAILENTKLIKLYSIDPFQQFPADIYKDGMNLDQDYFNVLFYHNKVRLAPFGQRSEIMRKTSLEAVKLFDDNSLDFIYLDANHAYRAVKDDLHAWFKTIRRGGIISGDDYGHAWHPGVQKAVDEFFSQKNISFHVEHSTRTWWAIKP